MEGVRDGPDGGAVRLRSFVPRHEMSMCVHARSELGDLVTVVGLPDGSLDPDLPVRAVSVSRAQLVVPVLDASLVQSARPRWEALWELCRRHGTTGAYLFAPHPDGRADHVVARQFPVEAGYPEDAATGVAAGALAAYLVTGPGWRQVRVDQGDAMGRPSRLHAAALGGPDGPTRSMVAGVATLRSWETLDLATVLA